MQVSEILRKLADLVAQTETEVAPAPTATAPATPDAPQPGSLQAHLQAVEVSNDDDTESSTMVAPLQQELELLKKATGVDNNTDNFVSNDAAEGKVECEAGAGDEDELAVLKRRAGIGEQPSSPHNYAEDTKPASVNPRAEAAKEYHKSRKTDSE